MSDNTKIQWCDHSASPWHGCSHAKMPDGTEHPGCANCYAEDMAKRNPSILGVWGDDGARVKSKSFVANLRRWNREAERTGKRVSVFPSLCDPFEDRPELVPWRREMFEVIDECPWVDLLLLTKRPENVRRMWSWGWGTAATIDAAIESGYPNRQAFTGKEIPYKASFRHNVWLLASISDQQSADAMIPPLLGCRDLVPVLGVSAEPLVGPISLSKWLPTVSKVMFVSDVEARRSGMKVGDNLVMIPKGGALDWVIIGGESGRNARPCNVDWIRNLKDQCQAAGVPAFVKQFGAKIGMSFAEWNELTEGGIANDYKFILDSAGADYGVMQTRDRKGGDPLEWPEDLRVREFPRGIEVTP